MQVADLQITLLGSPPEHGHMAPSGPVHEVKASCESVQGKSSIQMLDLSACQHWPWTLKLLCDSAPVLSSHGPCLALSTQGLVCILEGDLVIPYRLEVTYLHETL